VCWTEGHDVIVDVHDGSCPVELYTAMIVPSCRDIRNKGFQIVQNRVPAFSTFGQDYLPVLVPARGVNPRNCVVKQQFAIDKSESSQFEGRVVFPRPPGEEYAETKGVRRGTVSPASARPRHSALLRAPSDRL
jgi:hypothetical protein